MKKKSINLHSLLYAALVLLAVMASCSKQGPQPADVAARAAKVYYDSLLAGGYEHWVDAQYRADSIPESYREQLVANAKMFVAAQQAEHHGIAEVQVARAKADTAQHVADVFLIFVYGDSTREEVLVPMVEHDGRWMLR